MAKDLKVLFSVPPGFIMWPQGTLQLETTMPSCALYTLAAVVENAGFPCTILDPVEFWRFCRTDQELENKVKGHDVVCISANSIIWPSAIPLIKKIAAIQPRPMIIAGGLHPTYCDEHVLNTTDVDIVVRGEGEIVLGELLKTISRGLPLDGIQGLTFRGNGHIVRTPDRKPLSEEEISNTPLPFWDRLPPMSYSFIPVEMSRGCKFGCSFCSIYHKHLWRSASDECIRKRVEHAVQYATRVRQSTLMFTDDCFTGDPGKLRVVESALREFAPNIGIGIEGRASDVLNQEVLTVLGKMNIEFIQIGVECGYDQGLRKIKKGISIEQVIASIHAMHSIGLHSQVKYSFIIGFPWESNDGIMRTINFAMSLGSRYGNKIQINWLLMTPGSEIYEQFLRNGTFSPSDFDRFPPELSGFFIRCHPAITRLDALMINEYAVLAEQRYPWVGTLGNVFRLWTRHAHLPSDRMIPVSRMKKDTLFNIPEISLQFLNDYLPPVLHLNKEGD